MAILLLHYVQWSIELKFETLLLTNYIISIGVVGGGVKCSPCNSRAVIKRHCLDSPLCRSTPASRSLIPITFSPMPNPPATPLPPPQPVYVLRGHASPIHTLLFLRQNLRLLSGDADGWVVLWSLPTKRPVAVWKAHDGTILGATTWGEGRIVT